MSVSIKDATSIPATGIPATGFTRSSGFGDSSASCRRMDAEKRPQLRAKGCAVSCNLHPRLVPVASCRLLGRYHRFG